MSILMTPGVLASLIYQREVLIEVVRDLDQALDDPDTVYACVQVLAKYEGRLAEINKTLDRENK